MSIRISRLLGPTVFLALLAGPSLAAAGTVVTVDFSGTLSTETGVPNGVAAGDPISGMIAFTILPTSSPAGTTTGTTATYTYTGDAEGTDIHSFSFQIDNSSGAQLYLDSYSGDVVSPYQIKLSYISSSGATDFVVSGVTGNSATTPTFSLTMVDPHSAGGYSATNLPLPSATVMPDFAKTAATLVYTDGNFSANITSFQIYDGNGDPPPPGTQVYSGSVPEPSSLLLAIIGSLTAVVGNAIARRKRPGVKKG
jgi:hypothetical protein